jgi:small-conductance mechanosensitive channel
MPLRGLTFWGNSVEDWAIAIAIVLAFQLVFRILQFALRRLFLKRREQQRGAAAFRLADILASVLVRTRILLLGLVSLYFGSQALTLSAGLMLWIRTLAIMAIIIQMGIWLDAALLLWFGYYQRDLQDDAARLTTMRAATFLVRVVIFSSALLLVLDNIPGVEITTLIASLGVGGIAVALALQKILADLFASLSISLDKPFVIGDFIIVGDMLGTVERIGLKTTRLRSLGGEQLVMANSDLLDSRIRNYKRMLERRVVFSFGVIYETPYEKLERIPTMVREIIEGLEQTRFDRAHFKEYGDFSLNFEVVYYVLSPDYNLYMDKQQAINLALFQRFRDESIVFAYPTRTLYVEGMPGGEESKGAPPVASHVQESQEQESEERS